MIKMKALRIILPSLVLAALLLLPIQVSAADAPPTDFVATYVNPQEVDLSWTLNPDPDLDFVMIRFAYGRQGDN